MTKHSSATMSEVNNAVETAKERFHRLAPKRVDLALHRLKLVGNLAGPGYEYTPEEANQLIGAILEGVAELRRKFEKPASKKSFSFT